MGGSSQRGRPPGRGGLPPGFVLVSVIFCNFNFNIDFYRLGVSFCASWGAPGSISEGFGLPKPSPNPPKIDPKSSLEKTLDFSSDFVHFFLVFRSSISWKCAFSYSKTTNPEVFAKIMLFRFSSIFLPKNLPKTLPKRGPDPSKIDAENVLIFNIDFLRFWPRFGRVLVVGLQDGAKLTQECENRNARCVFWLS